ncbi:hypothetical protein FHS29_005577 [Saccharothrix tamanrassetensis]|uniref:Uncharacterized protein n=1 Tax=Saccharothrix tamanrassetensis TaxID=1051531 RepID=A0A841CS43_9PSEU|nr:hypothetical protein [Saccharothrix tamanrassetensis]MBB5958968.1 hypothetical protein [Saccharothrix tamanrassetensis]
MSIASGIRPVSGSWIRLAAWVLVVLGTAGVVAVLASPTAGVVVGAVLALVALVGNALAKASRKMDEIFREELD